MTNKSTTHNREHFFILAVVLLLANQFLTTTVNAIYINAKDKSPISVNSGVYTVSFNSPCPVTLGYISYANYADLDKLKTSIPNTFTVISKDSTYYSSYTTYSFSGTAYFVLYNNGTSPCSVTTFTTSLDTTAITSSTLKVRLPYGVKTTFYRYYSSYRNLIIKSDGSSSMSIALKIEYLSTAPSTTPTSVTSTYTISGYDSKSIDFSPSYTGSSYSTAYIYLQCNNVAGCPVQLSLDYGSDSGSSTVIGAVVGPIVFVVIFVFIVIISVVSTIFARRRRMLLLAAATTAVATSSTTTHHYVPVPTPVSTTTTTTEKTTVYVPPPVTTTAQQPYIQPGVPQPYNPNYGNQAYYSQPPPTTGQPYQPQPYTQPYAQPYTSQPYTPQPYPNQPPPPYYNPGVGVAQQEPMPAFNPNVDRV